MKINKNSIILTATIIIAVILRVLCIDKSGGLWYDEIVSYKEAVQPDILTVINYVLKTDVHLPVYPILLHLWVKIFSTADISLRLFSVLCGVLTTLAAYFAGKELKDNKTGLIACSIFAINSFLIYYSQEVRLYSLLMFLVTLQTYLAVKLSKTSSLKLSLIFTAICWLVINTYTISFIYTAAVLIMIYYFNIKNKKPLKNLNIGLGIFILLSIPSLVYLILNHTAYTEQINGYYCDWSSLIVVLQNWFSPVLTGIYNNPVNYIDYLTKNCALSNIIFILCPILLSLGLIIYGVKKKTRIIYLLIPSLFFILAEIAAFKLTNFKILARYTAAALPNILLVIAVAISSLPKIKRLNIIIPLSLFLINFSYLIFSPNAAFKLPREGVREMAQMISTIGLSSGEGQLDYLVVWNRKEVFDKYLETKNINILSILKDFSYRSERILGNEKELNKVSLTERKTLLRAYFADLQPPQNNIALMYYIISNMKSGQKFIITTNSYFDKFSPQKFLETINNDEAYNLISYNDLLTIKSLIVIKEMCANNLKFIDRLEKNGNVILVFEK